MKAYAWKGNRETDHCFFGAEGRKSFQEGEWERHTAEGFVHSTALRVLSRLTNHSQGQGRHHPGSGQCFSPKMLMCSQRAGWGGSADSARVLRRPRWEKPDYLCATTGNQLQHGRKAQPPCWETEQDSPACRIEPFWPTFWVQWSRKHLGHQMMTSCGFCHWNFPFHWEKIN